MVNVSTEPSFTAELLSPTHPMLYLSRFQTRCDSLPQFDWAALCSEIALLISSSCFHWWYNLYVSNSVSSTFECWTLPSNVGFTTWPSNLSGHLLVARRCITWCFRIIFQVHFCLGITAQPWMCTLNNIFTFSQCVDPCYMWWDQKRWLFLMFCLWTIGYIQS